jgi:hypothetical protein
LHGSPPEWVFCTTSLCQSAGRYPLPMGSNLIFGAYIRAELRGFRQHQSLYGLCQDGEKPAALTLTDGA